MQIVDYEKTRVRLLEVFIRDIANSVVQRIDFDKLDQKNQTFLSKTRERFCFDDDNGWKFLVSALDCVGDSEFAITNFINTKIDNGRSFNTDERYLRLYGILSAVYIQRQSILKLCELFKMDNLKLIKKDFDKLNITFLRHCISAHPMNYDTSSEVVSYRVVRASMEPSGDLQIIDNSNSTKTYNIYDCISQYRIKAELILSALCEKVITNTYNSAPEKQEQLKSKLSKIEK